MSKFGPYEPYFSSAMRDVQTGNWTNYFDPTDELANRYGFYMQIYAVKSKAQLSFKAFLENFTDNYDVNTEQKQYVNSQNVEIRQSGIVRKLDISLAIPSANIAQAKFHMQNLNLLVKSLYSTSNRKGMVSSVGAPKFKIRLLNLMSDPSAGTTATHHDSPDAVEPGVVTQPDGISTSSSAVLTGLTGFIDGLTYEFDLDAGFMTDTQELGFVYPKLVRLSFSYYPQTTRNPIWSGSDKKGYKFNLKNWPYAYKGIEDDNFILGASDAGATTSEINEQNRARINKLLGLK
tara:strand:- start:1694 stop:2563 length:870 start_codon:yes stop_codon:yes gene_type:complete